MRYSAPKEPRKGDAFQREGCRFGMFATWAASCALYAAMALQNDAFAQSTPQLDVQMKFSKPAIVLGEPVWVNLTIRNLSSVPVAIDPGDYCPDFGTRPLTAEIANATPGDGHRERCVYGDPPGSCAQGADATVLQPSTAVSHRYLLEGDFHFTHPGVYRVLLHLHLKSRPAQATDVGPFIVNDETPVSRTLMLSVLQPKPAALLAEERHLAVTVNPATDKEAWQTNYGLSEHPVAGMESVFLQWLVRDNVSDDMAITGLKNLNTSEARKKLAAVASGKQARAPTEAGSAQWVAAEALSKLGDRSYAPLMIRLLSNPDRDVHRSAIYGLGRLGGDAELERLAAMARTKTGLDQGDAYDALSDSQSRRAVPILIDLITHTSDPRTAWSNWPLTVLTHYMLPNRRYLPTPRQAQSAWQRWWDANRRTARIFSEFEYLKTYGPHRYLAPPPVTK